MMKICEASFKELFRWCRTAGQEGAKKIAAFDLVGGPVCITLTFARI